MMLEDHVYAEGTFHFTFLPYAARGCEEHPTGHVCLAMEFLSHE